MSLTRYGSSPWLDPSSRIPRRAYPSLSGEHETDVAVIGGGLAGGFAAAVFARAGHQVAVIEAERVGLGATGTSPGVVLPAPGVRFSELRARRGLRAARHIWTSSRRAALDVAAALRRWRVRCDLRPLDYLLVATSADDERMLEREATALSDAGIDIAWLSAGRAQPATGLEARAAIRMTGAAVLDPVRAAVGVAAVAEKAGAQIFERTVVTRIRPGAAGVEIATSRGLVRARHVVVATARPVEGFGALRRHVRDVEGGAVLLPMAESMRRSLGLPSQAIVSDVAAETLLWRPAASGVLVYGHEHPAVAARLREKSMVPRAGALMYEFLLRYPGISGMHPTHAWLAPAPRSTWGLLIAGPHRNFPHHFFSLGLGASGIGGAWQAARILLRRVQADADPADREFEFSRDKR